MTAIQAALAFPVLLAIGFAFGLFAMCVCGALLLAYGETREWLLRRADRRSDEALAQHIGEDMAAKYGRECVDFEEKDHD